MLVILERTADMKIYFDMDGVLADFNKGIVDLCGIAAKDQDLQTEAESEKMWEEIRKVDHFYDKLEPLPGAVKMFKLLHDKYGSDCEILTGIPKPKRHINNAGKDKISWAHRLLSPTVRVNIVFKEEKKRFCEGKDSILIDDLQKNIDEWREYGGTGILHKSTGDTMKILKNLSIID